MEGLRVFVERMWIGEERSRNVVISTRSFESRMEEDMTELEMSVAERAA